MTGSGNSNRKRNVSSTRVVKKYSSIWVLDCFVSNPLGLHLNYFLYISITPISQNAVTSDNVLILMHAVMRVKGSRIRSKVFAVVCGDGDKVFCVNNAASQKWRILPDAAQSVSSILHQLFRYHVTSYALCKAHAHAITTARSEKWY